jgi:hypothetical protein
VRRLVTIICMDGFCFLCCCVGLFGCSSLDLVHFLLCPLVGAVVIVIIVVPIMV